MSRYLSVAVVLVALSPVAALSKPLSLTFLAKPGDSVADRPAVHLTAGDVLGAGQTAAPTPAFAYSDGYRVRAKVHKIASLTMLPLVGAQGLLGASMYTDPTPTKRGWHRRLAWGIGGLFAVNTVTGVTNLIEGRKDPNGRALRIAHAILMLVSDAGFLTAAVMRPDATQPDFKGQKSRHRAIALTSAGTATLGYLLMHLGHK